ncbi:S1C family serine protease [Hasllibacter halocynthiae]|uniref:S1C family serine protease n=1 Tax=Hasllibacter halocynthiae TaxID=595589 RepID=UPI001FE43D5C|nr:trypsin-like peptidase domain-containing protein [Hasllibacter halocynthiae]
MEEHQNDRTALVARALAPALLAFALAFGAVLAWRLAPAIEVWIDGPPGVPRIVEARGDLAEEEAANIALFEAAQDGTVFISTTGAAGSAWGGGVEVPRGTGTGFIWDDRGHVVTNAHVLDGAARANVRLADGRTFDARLVGRDRRHDLAVLRIAPAAGLPDPLPLGTSADLRVGQRVFAIGNPFGLDFTLTTGIVSALDRELPGEGVLIRGLVQTDAAINPGNSGGPLLDSAGRVIGVNTAIYSPSGASAGIGFAVPADTVNRVVPQIVETGRYIPPVIGVEVDPRVDAMAARRGLTGTLVLGLAPGGPAEAAGLVPAETTPDGGLRIGTRILAVDGEEVAHAPDLLAALDDRRPGEEVVLLLDGPGGRREVAVTLAAGT